EDPPPEVLMVDNRTMAELLQAPTEGSGTLPSNTITNPKEELKGITTRSGVTYQGPTIPTPSKQGTEPVVAPVSALMTNVKSSIPYPSRRDNERRRMDECLALSDLGASINLMPLSVWEGLSLSEPTPTCMTLELADRSVSKPIGITKDVSFKVGVFHFPADFVVVDFEPDPRVPLILGRCFLKTGRALINVHKGELTLRIRNEAITYNLDQTVRYSANYNQMTTNKFNVIEMACEEYSQEVLDFSDVTASGNPTPHDDPIVSTTGFILFEEADAFLGLEDDPNSSKINPFYYDLDGDILLLEAILNSKPLPPLLNHEQYLSSFKKELKACEAKTVKSFVNKPPEILMEDDYKPAVQHQRRVNPKIHDVIKNEVEKLLDAGLIYPIYDSPWVSPTMEVFMDDFSVFGNSFENCLSRLDKMLQRIEVDRAKVDVIAKLPHPITVKGVWSFLGHAGFYRRFIQNFSKISRPMTHLLEKNTPFIFSEDYIKAFQTLKKKLTKAPILIAPNWDLPFELMCDASDFSIAKALPTNDARVVCKFLKSLFARFGAPRAIISDRGTHFCNDQFAKVMLKYEVTHRLSTAYHPQTSGKVKVSNRGLKRILKRTIGENQASWSDKLDDALWVFRTAYKTPIGCTPYKLVYGKACHLPIELEHKAYWVLKQANFDLAIVGDHRKI
nr:reverse transcriptase domain-containing protein [Tanacetum cinerariifolium]